MLSKDVLFLVLNYCSWDMFEQLALVNKYHLSCLQQYLQICPHRINDLMVLLRLFPHASWNYYYLSANPNINTSFIEKIIKFLTAAPYPIHLGNLFDSTKLAMNPVVTWDLVCNYPLVPWNYKALTENPNITWNIINAHPHKGWDRITAYHKFLDNGECEIDPHSYAGIMGFTRPIGPVGSAVNGIVGATVSFGCNGLVGSTASSITIHEEILARGLTQPEIDSYENLTWESVYFNRHLNWSFHDLSRNMFSGRKRPKRGS